MEFETYKKIASRPDAAQSFLESALFRALTLRISFLIFKKTRLSANSITIFSATFFIVLYLLAYWSSVNTLFLVGFFLYTILDNVDGELARARSTQSDLGAALESLVDSTLLIFTGILILSSMRFEQLEFLMVAVLFYFILFKFFCFEVLYKSKNSLLHEIKIKNYVIGGMSYFFLLPYGVQCLKYLDSEHLIIFILIPPIFINAVNFKNIIYELL